MFQPDKATLQNLELKDYFVQQVIGVAHDFIAGKLICYLVHVIGFGES